MVEGPRRTGLGILAAAVVVVVVAVAAVVVIAHRQSPHSKAERTVSDYLSDWSKGHYAQMATVADQPAANFTAFYQASAKGLEEKSADYQLVSVQTGSNPSATFRATLTLADYPDWSYEGTLPLV